MTRLPRWTYRMLLTVDGMRWTSPSPLGSKHLPTARA